MSERYIAHLSDGDYGEWEVIDAVTREPVVRCAWFSRKEAVEEAERMNEEGRARGNG